MSGANKPKFFVGEPVIIEKTGKMAKIVDIHRVGEGWYYQLHQHEELYPERVLRSCKEQPAPIAREKVHLDYEYRFGDLVSVEGYPGEWFVVIGFRAEIWRYEDSAWEEIIYELSHIEDRSWLEANEEELTLIAKKEDTEQFLSLAKPVKKQHEKRTIRKEKSTKATIDQLLDMYNDYQYLYELFGDASYKRKMKEIVQKLAALTHNPYMKDSQ